MALDINTAGLEFVKTVLTLYRSGKYYREKEILAKKLLDYSLEAGRLVTELGVCPEDSENDIARNAMEELKRALFVLDVMQSEGVYSKRRTKPVTTLGDSIKELISLYIVDQPQPPQTPAPQYAAPVEQPEAVAPAPAVPQLQGDNGGQLSLTNGEGKKDDGGFNEIYYGNV